MDKHYFIELLRKYLDGNATKAEVRFIWSYYNLFQSEPEVLALFGSEKRNELKKDLREDIWKNIGMKEKSVKKKGSIVLMKTALAAAASILILLAVRQLFWQADPVKPAAVHGLALIRNSNHVISLPDGSTVTMSSGSKLNYPSAFSASGKREVYLEGEAFFDVKHDTSHPFVVHAANVNVTVLGTAFNVKAFSEENDITVTVKRGKVSVSDPYKTLGTITPLQQIVYNKQNQNSIQQTVVTEKYLKWRERDCLFDNLTITEVAALLEERFKVKIFVDDRIASSGRFTAAFPKNESLDEALKSICEFNTATYRYDKEKATVYINADH
ncbi:MAG: FecR domain-containing protein [Flavitalea sp.]